MPVLAPQLRVGATALTSLVLALLGGCGGHSRKEILDAGSVESRPVIDVNRDAGVLANRPLSLRCTSYPNTPGCPLFCTSYPLDEHCTQAGSLRCSAYPNTPGCPLFCTSYPLDEHCTEAGSLRCSAYPNTPGCLLFCTSYPLDEHCTR